ncbi:alpha/beta hydrolase [Vagococcus elongatus]|uniref:1,4-beta-xylanase n=1 Tax=Vagococcus elongatus TaxID=180344 RepID=A0A430AT66_9ENTE|nr:alpha/beta hydrolase [Vagococcus elongatus]RSU11252.1 1,4-beta-xylanase [Vagococcus elongatus]
MKNKRIKINDTGCFDTYLLHNSKEYNIGKRRPIVIICPGGGYAFTSDREAEVIALKFNSIGLNSIILWYTTNDEKDNIPKHALNEAAYTVKYVREHANEWLIDTENVIICGFSAGGHLALQMANNWNKEKLSNELATTKNLLKINLAILGYPLVHLESAFEKNDLGFAANYVDKPKTGNERFFGTLFPEKQDLDSFNQINNVNSETPPMFIWHTYEDVVVDVEQSLLLGLKLRENGIPFEMHIFEKGEHGLALGDRTTARKKSHYNSHVAKWFELCERWLSSYID